MRITLLFLFILTLTCNTAASQLTDKLPWPPENTEILFGPDIEILDVQLQSTSRLHTRHFTNSVENSEDQRAVITEDGRTYPWPDEFLYSTGLYQIGIDTSVLVLGDQVYVGSSHSSMGEFNYLWRLDLETGEWTRFNQVPDYVNSNCGSLPFRGSLRIRHYWDSGWVFIAGSNNQQHVCELQTGQVSPPLPQGYADWQVISTRPSNLPASLNHILLRAHPETASEENADLFAYNLSSRQFIHLGDFVRFGRIAVEILHSTSLLRLNVRGDGLIEQDVEPSSWLIDLNAQHLQQVPLNGIYRENPSRLEYWFPDDTEEHSACEKRIVDLSTWAETTYRLETNCWQEFHQNSVDYYRVIDGNRKQSEVIAVNSVDGQFVSLYQGEIEQISWISPDQEFGAFIVDSSGRVDNEGGRTTLVYPSQDAKFILIHFATETIVYETPAYSTGIAATWSLSARSLRDDLVAVSDDYTTTLLQFEEGNVSTHQVQGYIGREIGDGWAIIYPPMNERLNEYGAAASFELYQLNTEEAFPFVDLGSAVDDYWLDGEVEYLGDLTFEVTIGYIYDDYSDEYMLYDLAVYRLRLMNN